MINIQQIVKKLYQHQVHVFWMQQQINVLIKHVKQHLLQILQMINVMNIHSDVLQQDKDV